MNTAAALVIHTFYSSILGLVTAVQKPSFIPFPTHASHVSYSTLPLSPLVHPLQVELDLKRLRDPLQLQLPIQQLTTSEN